MKGDWPSDSPKILDKPQTRRILKTSMLIEAIKAVALEYANGEVASPERMVVPRTKSGVMLSMPAVARDVSIHKLVNVEPENRGRGLPTINGHVTVYDTQTGFPVCILDGPEVTGCRTAAVSMLGVQLFCENDPAQILLVGTGVQARFHLQAIHDLLPQTKVWVRGRSIESAKKFCSANVSTHSNLEICPPNDVPENVDVVILLTTSREVIYNHSAMPGRLIIGVGAFKPEMAEIGATTLAGSTIYVDDLEGAKVEAGDLLQAAVDWTTVKQLVEAIRQRPSLSRPIVFKTVGTAAWDLAAGRLAVAALHGE